MCRTIDIGKFGKFSADLLLGRPYYFTFELLEKDDGGENLELRVVPAAELHAEALGNDHATPAESRDEPTANEGGVEFDIVGEDGEVIMRSNRLTIDDPSRQTLSMEEIEELKKAGTGSGKDIIAKIMASHQAIDEKTSFSLAKYTLRKSRKYLKRFTVLPVDVGMVAECELNKEAYKVMELREESLGLICSWANIHCGEASRYVTADDGVSQIGGGRWLVVDDAGGLIVAAMAEKMGLLYPPEENDDDESDEEDDHTHTNGQTAPSAPEHEVNGQDEAMDDAPLTKDNDPETATADQPDDSTEQPTTTTPSDTSRRPRRVPQMSAQTNTLTLLTNNDQPSLPLLEKFGYNSGKPTPSHPLFTHLKTLTWLQLLYPDEDPSCQEPEFLTEEQLADMKSSKRGVYYKKRRRWEKARRVVDETRRGGFDGLVVASSMEAPTILRHLVPLVRGGGRVVVYSPNVEPMAELCDYYSKDRRAAFVARQHAKSTTNGIKAEEQENGAPGSMEDEEDPDFPVNPTLLLAPNLQTARARHWQVLPGRTHPMMTSRGGAEGYIFTGTRVLPVEGKVEARGHWRGGKKRKTGIETAVQA